MAGSPSTWTATSILSSPREVWRRFVSTPGDITLSPDEVVVRLRSRTYSPVLRSADHPLVQVPWWGGRGLRFVFP
jgi:hypothetical protein